MHRGVISQVCFGKKNLISANGLHPEFRKELFRHLSCNITETPMTFYKCKVKCIQTEQCDAMWHKTLCRLCSYGLQGNQTDIDDFEFHPDVLLSDWMFGK